MTDLVKALRNRATWETATGITEPHEHIDWMAAEEIDRLREENARLRRIVKIAYAEGCYDISRTEKTQEEFEALWRRTFSYKIISGRGKDEAP